MCNLYLVSEFELLDDNAGPGGTATAMLDPEAPATASEDVASTLSDDVEACSPHGCRENLGTGGGKA